METSTKSRSKLASGRRSDEERIAELQRRVQELQEKAEAK
jgi:hypothetical protein